MVESKKVFPIELKKKIISRIESNVKIEFYDGVLITPELFNITILEPYKVVFSKQNKIINLYIIENKDEEQISYTFFIEEIGKENKIALNKLVRLINNSI